MRYFTRPSYGTARARGRDGNRKRDQRGNRGAPTRACLSIGACKNETEPEEGELAEDKEMTAWGFINV